MNISQYDNDDDLPSYKIIIVGQTQIGKTKLLTRYKFGTYTDEGVTTLGVDNFIIKTPQAKFAYYDTAGQDRYRSIVSTYYRGSNACLLVYDVSSMKSFEQMAYYYNTVKQTIPECLIYIVGCKADKQRQVSQETVYKYYKGYHHEITSAKKDENVKQVFQNLQKELLATHKVKNKGSRIKTSQIIVPRNKKSKKCCD